MFRQLDLNDREQWSSFSRSSQCEQEFPPSVAKKISLFQQLLVIQALRPDRLQSAMVQFASKTLGNAIKLVVSLQKCIYKGIFRCKFFGPNILLQLLRMKKKIHEFIYLRFYLQDLKNFLHRQLILKS